MIHSASSTASWICFVSLEFEKWGRTYVQTSLVNIVITTGSVWVGLVDQHDLLRHSHNQTLLYFHLKIILICFL